MATYYRWRKSTIGYAQASRLLYESNTVILDLNSGNIYYSANTPSLDPEDGKYIVSNGKEHGLPATLTTGLAAFYYCTSLTESTGYLLVQGADVRYEEYDKSHTLATVISMHSYGSVTYYYSVQTAGTFVEYVYSTSSSAYPNGGVSGDYYYDQRTTITSPTAPSGLTYPNPITTPSVTVSWSAATSNVPNYPVSFYSIRCFVNGESTPYSTTTVASTKTTADIDIPSNAKTVRFDVRAMDTNSRFSDATTGTTATVILAPTLTVPQMVMQGQQASISWTSVDGADSYTVQRKSSADADWTQVYSGSATTFSETVGTWTSLQYRVCAVVGSTSGGWATSASIPVVSASALVISGSDGDLGTVINDIPYSISTDTGNPITATITVNGAVIFSGSVGNSASDVIPVLDLASGTGTIVIEASVQAASGSVSAARTWTYTKAPITFPNAGSVAQLTQEGANIWPKTLAECVRLPGGRTLDEIVALPVANIETGSYVGTGTYGSSNPNTLTFAGKPVLIFLRANQYAGSYGNIAYPIITGQVGIAFVNANGNDGNAIVSFDGNTMSYYSTSSADSQFNHVGVLYDYAALTIGGDTE